MCQFYSVVTIRTTQYIPFLSVYLITVFGCILITNDTYIDKTMWQTVKNITNVSKQNPPRILTHNNQVITKLKLITNIANNYFHNKISTIRSKFTTNKYVLPIQILQFLIPKNDNLFHLQPPSISDINKIIKNLKATNSVGSDIITSKIIKKITPKHTPHLTHLLTTIINTNTYPSISKTDRISPTHKKDKPIDDIAGYRPICNLSVIDKIFQ